MTTTPPLADVPSLRLSWIGSAGQMLPVVIPVDDLPLFPEPALLTGLRQVHDSIREEQRGGGRIALALRRPEPYD
jgi:hypothetical protein